MQEVRSEELVRTELQFSTLPYLLTGKSWTSYSTSHVPYLQPQKSSADPPRVSKETNERKAHPRLVSMMGKVEQSWLFLPVGTTSSSTAVWYNFSHYREQQKQSMPFLSIGSQWICLLWNHLFFFKGQHLYLMCRCVAYHFGAKVERV